MDQYRKFAVETVALVAELNRKAGPTADGLVPVDARLFQSLVRESAHVLSAWNHYMDSRFDESLRRLRKRFDLPEPMGQANREAFVNVKEETEIKEAANG